jgi:hypothetical protein
MSCLNKKLAHPTLSFWAGLISSIFRVKKSNSNPNLKLKFKPKRPKYRRNHGFEFEFCALNLNFKTIKTKNYI